MQINVKKIREADCSSDVLILPFFEERPESYIGLKPSIISLIRNVFSKEFRGVLNEILISPAPFDIKPKRVLFVGLGKKESVSDDKVRQAGGKAFSYLRDMNMKSAALSTVMFPDIPSSPATFIEGGLLSLYTYKRYKTTDNIKAVDSIMILSKPSKDLSAKILWAKSVVSAVSFARDLINTPSNDMTPVHLAKAAMSLKRKNLSITVIDRAAAKKIGMHAYLSVSSGSVQPPKFIVLEYKGAKGAPFVLIGKSVTFDSGGLSLKPSEGMEKMKYDMAGGAAVLGVMKAASELKMKAHIIGILPATENLPGCSATRPGDVVRALSNKTIEIVNTDAEGRLTLADALAYSKRFHPRAVIDIATLTGACSIAFGNETIAMMGNNEKLIADCRQAGEATYERVWEMPLFEEYKEYIKSDIADLKNAGSRNGSLMASAYFLKEFAENMPWIHLDIAGTAWVEKDRPYIPKGASGIGVRLILNLISNLK